MFKLFPKQSDKSEVLAILIEELKKFSTVCIDFDGTITTSREIAQMEVLYNEKELDINKKIASIDKEALTTILTIGVLNEYFAGSLFATYLIGDDAVQKLQTISERKYLAAATTIQKIVRGHQVRKNNKT